MPIIIFIIAFLTFLFYLFQDNEKKKSLNRLKINELLPAIENLLNEFKDYENFKNGYFNHYKLKVWNKKAIEIYNKISQQQFQNIGLPDDTIDLISDFLNRYELSAVIRGEFNKEYIENELIRFQSFFNEIEGKKLDDQQRRAIVTDEDNNLIVAGAGSGKTTTIAGKVSYLLKRFDIEPDDILLIAFTRKACDEMRNRISKKMNIDIDVMTFHKLGLDIIAEASQKKPTIFDESKLKPLVNNIFSELMRNQEYLLKVTKYFTEYLKPYKSQEDFENHGAYIQYMKDHNIKTYKQVPVNIQGRITMLRESCKSMEEVMIANFLFLNNVKYEYEKKYKYDTASEKYSQYKPDFYLPDYDIYIEHFAIDRNNNVPAWFHPVNAISSIQGRYVSQMKWKKETHIKFSTTLIETFSYEKSEGTLLSNLQTKLRAAGVNLKPKTPDEIWKILNDLAEDEVKSFTQLIITFLTLVKSNNYSIAEIKQKNTKIKIKHEKHRNEAFLEIFSSMLDKYNTYLNTINEIDFSDMINDATAIIKNGNSNRKYKYVIIDEFQDISIGRYKLIKSILDNNHGCKLFCVGDDWQSIYRFSGSDISIFTEFEKNFGTTALSYIENTYRFNSELINISSSFILKNPKQVKKTLKEFNQNQTKPYEIIYSDNSDNNHGASLQITLDKILKEMEDQVLGKKILLLGRYNHDIDFLKRDTVNFTLSWNYSNESFDIKYNSSPNLKIEFLTIHRAKGLESDYVIIINCSSGKYGFPSEQADDPILNLLLTQADQFPNGEERRLFYVAITRCKRKVFMIVNSKYKSKFIVELEGDYNLLQVNNCPQCKTGILSEFSGTSKKGYEWCGLSCSNWSWGCDYIQWQ